MASEPIFRYDERVIGVEVDLGTFEITQELVDAYLGPLHDSNPLFRDEGFAPPYILCWAQPDDGLDAKVEFGNSAMGSGARLDLHEPLRVGDRITTRVQVRDVYAKTGRSGTMVFVVRQYTYTNQHGRLAATAEHASVHQQL